MVIEVEDALAEADAAVAAGDKAKARSLIATSEALINRELGSHPDRHQLLAHAAELRDGMDGRKIAAPPPPPVVVAAVEQPKPEIAEIVETPAVEKEDPVAAFKEGPLRDRKQALRMIGTAKRAPKKVKGRLYREARDLLASCASEGERMVETAPKLQRTSFKIGARKRSAGWVVVQCRSKVRSLERRLEKRS